MGTLLTIFSGILGGIFKFSSELMSMLREKQLIDYGRALEHEKNMEKDLISSKIETEVNREQTEILIAESDKKEIISKIETGKF